MITLIGLMFSIMVYGAYVFIAGDKWMNFIEGRMNMSAISGATEFCGVVAIAFAPLILAVLLGVIVIVYPAAG